MGSKDKCSVPVSERSMSHAEVWAFATFACFAKALTAKGAKKAAKSAKKFDPKLGHKDKLRTNREQGLFTRHIAVF